MNDSAQEFKAFLTEVIQKYMAILGPSITLIKARSVHGLTITDEGIVTNISGESEHIKQQLLEHFRELSSMLVKKSLAPLLSVQSTAKTENIH